jgi:hypothetical protein
LIDLGKIPVPKADETPHRFLFWGPAMVGKTTLAQRFPDPVIISTDGNQRFNHVRTIAVQNWTQVREVIEAFAAQQGSSDNWPVKTIVIDLVDDLVTMIRSWATMEYNRKFGQKVKEFDPALNYGKMSVIYTNQWVWMRDKLKGSDGYVIFNSYSVERKLEGRQDPELVPGLREKDLNTILGICDVEIKMNFAGNSRIFQSTRNRSIGPKGYNRSSVDPRIAKALEGISGFWDNTNK